jgi:hypothetical protein
MKPWIKAKLKQVAEKKRYRCENPNCKGRGGGLEAHHGIFSRSKAHPEYDVTENMILLCHRCNVQRVLDNKDGRIWSLKFIAKHFGKDHMIDWLESLKETHKSHVDIDYFIRILEDE